MLYIDKYAYIPSAFKNINPTAKLIFGLTAIISAVCSKAFSSYALILGVMLIVTVFIAKTPLMYFIKLMALPLGFLLMGVTGIIVNISKTPAADTLFGTFFMGSYFCVTKNGAYLAAGLTLKSLAAVSCLYYIILTTPVRDIARILYKLKCPNTLLVLTILTYRFIFILLEVSVVKLKSQQLRHGYESSKTFAKSFGMLFGSVFVQSLADSAWVYKAMQARGCDGGLAFLPDNVGFNKREISLLAAAFALASAVILQNVIR